MDENERKANRDFATFMSHKRMELYCDKDLIRSAVVVGGVILEHINRKKMLAWPSVLRISLLTGYSKRMVYEAIRQLVEAGHFRKVSRGTGSGPGSRKSTNIYKPILRVKGTSPLRMNNSSLKDEGRFPQRVKEDSPEPLKELLKELLNGTRVKKSGSGLAKNNEKEPYQRIVSRLTFLGISKEEIWLVLTNLETKEKEKFANKHQHVPDTDLVEAFINLRQGLSNNSEKGVVSHFEK